MVRKFALVGKLECGFSITLCFNNKFNLIKNNCILKVFIYICEVQILEHRNRVGIFRNKSAY